MGYVLFSPIGNTDPIRGFRDGAWLHICRVYQPRTCVIYLTADMCKREDTLEPDGSRKDLYARTLEMLNRHLYNDETERYIQLKRIRDEKCVNAHSLEYFWPIFQEELTRLHRECPDDKLLVNVSSGTAGMKSALLAICTLLPFPVYAIQVSDPKKGNTDKSEIVTDQYLVEEAFGTDEDNEPDFPNRTSEQSLVNQSLAMHVNELCKLIREGDYHTALREVQSESLREFIPAKTLAAIQGAECRSCMKTKDSVKYLDTSGFKLGSLYGVRPNEKIWQCAEYLLTMKNDLKRGAFDNFIRKLTPLLTNLCELYLESIGKNVYKNGADSKGIWIRANMPDEWKAILDREFCRPFKDRTLLAASNMAPLISEFGTEKAADLVKTLRDTENKVRNTFAHEIVPFGRKELETALKEAYLPGITTPEALVNCFCELLKIIRGFPASYWNSYDAMNDHICALLKEPYNAAVQQG